jgi:GMP synthase (glutamine-hydrolysing)
LRNSLCSGLQRPQAVLLTHGDSIERVCDKFKICATSSSDIVAGIYNEQARIYGVQFHPEVDLTLQGKKMMANFLFEIARITPNFTMASRKEECIRYIREKVGSNKVLVRLMNASLALESDFTLCTISQLLVSGGVDSTVCAALLRVALQPSQVTAVHIDNGEDSI